ncbi:MAG: hypothetical protein AT709_02480 [Caldivirga sp. MG_3]|jgi:hypothetical protein|nr:MAG: hypothetical protein AT709_02480 [Caldivirga sp. MG_3]
MHGAIIVVSDERVKEAALFISEELGLPLLVDMGNGVLPILNVDSGKAVLESLVKRINEDFFIIIVVGKETWRRLEESITQVDMARLLMRLELRGVGVGST